MFVKVILLLAATTAVLGKSAKIIGGTPAAPGEIPFQVSIQDKDGNHYCGGAIVGNNVLLTAASCIVDLNIGQSRIRSGSIDVSGGLEHRVTSANVHPNFTMSGPAGLPHNDVAVVLVNPNFPANENTGRAFMPLQDYTIPDGTLCTVSGWGTTSFGGPSSSVLLKVQVPTVSDAECAAAYADLFPMHEEDLCAGVPEGGLDACERDVGGPLFENGVVYGIYSVGGRCGQPGRPGIYTEVSAFRDWIDANSV